MLRLKFAHRDRRRQTVAVAAWVVLFLGTLTLAGCSRHGKAAPAGGSDVPPAKVNLKRLVELTRAEQRTLDASMETVGVLEAERQTDIAAGVSGVVDEVLFREGDDVTPQTVLLKIDQRRYLTAVDLAKANEKRAEVNSNLARDAYSRAQRGGGAISEEDRTKTLLLFKAAEAEILAAQAARVIAEYNLDRSRVRAPYAGRINQRRVTPGTYVEEKATVATIADLSRIRLVGWVPETAAATVRDNLRLQDQRLRSVRVGLPLAALASPWAGYAGQALIQQDAVSSGFDPEFSLQAFPNRNFRARIFYMSTVASPDTHMFECKAEVQTRGAGLELRPGYSARVRVPLQTNGNTCVVPEESVRASERGFIAFVPVLRSSQRGKSEWVAADRQLELGYRAPGWVEVRKGLLPGDWLVRRGAEALEDGTPIRIPEHQLHALEIGR